MALNAEDLHLMRNSTIYAHRQSASTLEGPALPRINPFASPLKRETISFRKQPGCLQARHGKTAYHGLTLEVQFDDAYP